MGDFLRGRTAAKTIAEYTIAVKIIAVKIMAVKILAPLHAMAPLMEMTCPEI